MANFQIFKFFFGGGDMFFFERKDRFDRFDRFFLFRKNIFPNATNSPPKTTKSGDWYLNKNPKIHFNYF